MNGIPSKDILPRKLLAAGIGISAVLVLVSGTAFYYASRYSHAVRKTTAGGAVTVTIAGKSCNPNELTVPAGRTVFEIVNTSDRAVEWEILDGVMVLEERENIAPGFTQSLTAMLEPGTYQITCGLLSNPRGTLHVTAAASGAQAAAQPSMKAFIGAMAEYKVYLASETDGFVTAANDLAEAIKAADLAKVRSLYEPARIVYAHLLPIAGQISDLDRTIEARADYFEKKEQDPAFVGLHRIEFGLFSNNSLEEMAPVANKLAANAQALADRIHDLRITPAQMISGAAAAMDRFATAGPGLDEDRYAHSDLASFDAALSGVQKVADLIKPIAAKTAPSLTEQVDKNITSLQMTLRKHRSTEGYVRYSTLTEDDKSDLKKQAAALAADLGKLLQNLRLS
ncbi:iron uptake system protein EfeO (plasmid) [Agrobacterium vitis]|uniref:iron uptake system protein EfeO n=1 Tax=Agrobacterium vitis TaxID=373 RepID=UPI0012E7B77B|nr:iron uptake system protein EfeO [Agrobacterium vitis]MVA27393.1 iron uptake system protein EfeO [Agrobacterium vitis]